MNLNKIIISRSYILVALFVYTVTFISINVVYANKADALALSINQAEAFVVEDDSLFDSTVPSSSEFVDETPVDPPYYNNPQYYGENPALTPAPTLVSGGSSGSGSGGGGGASGGGGGAFSSYPSLTPIPTPRPGVKTSPAPSSGSTDAMQASFDIIKFKDSPEIFIVLGNKIKWVPSPAVFTSLNLDWEKIEEKPAKDRALYNRIRLIRVEDDPKVYYITEVGRRRWIPTAEVFNSYGNKWEDIVLVTRLEADAILDVVLIRAIDDPKVYKLENNMKRWVQTESVFNSNGFLWSEIAPVNRTELNNWPEGDSIK